MLTFFNQIEANFITLSCNQKCATCQQLGVNTYCQTCDSSANLVLSPSGNDCICGNNTYYDPNLYVCISCPIQCNGCFLNNGNLQCISCSTSIIAAHNRKILTEDNLCSCQDRFYDTKILQCQPCHPSCLTCIDGNVNSCLNCSATDLREYNSGNKTCPCKPPSSEANPVVQACVSPCHITCLSCSGNQANQCLTCDVAQFRISDGSNGCKCMDGYYEDGNQDCQKCHDSCKTCSGSSDSQCITCEGGNKRTLDNNKCVCDPGFGENVPITPRCSTCHSSCETCENVNDNTCTQCLNGSNRKLDSGYCKCDKGYYDNGGTCDTCHKTCKECQGGNGDSNCTSCYESNFRVINVNKCDCKSGYSEYAPVQQSCFQCHYSCSACSGTLETECVSCDINKKRQQVGGNTCKCSDGFYDDGSNAQCQSCDQQCKTCSGGASNNCESCESSHFRQLNSTTHQCDCMINYSEFSTPQQKCQYTGPCHFSCSSCTGPSINECDSCSSSNQRLINGNYCLCKDGFYESGVALCSPCDKTCQLCNGGSSNDCIQCEGNRVINSTKCECKVNYTEFNPIQKQCNYSGPCHFSCKTCSGPGEDECITCERSSFRQLNGQNKCICINGYYDDQSNQLCKTCDITCLTCTGPSNTDCTSCDPAFRYQNVQANNVCDCKSGYSEFNPIVKQCQYTNCHYSCKTCIGPNKTDCFDCESTSNRDFTGGQCVCQNSFYDAVNTKNCLSCDNSCQTCSGGTNNNCLTCDANNFRKQDNTQCICIDNYYDDGVSICKQCTDSKCKKCDKNTQKCLECFDFQNRVLDASGNCVCKTDYEEDPSSANNTCKTIFNCSLNCLTCEKNNPDACLSCDTSRILTLNQSKKVCECKSAYYYNSNTNMCNQCIQYCLKCNEKDPKGCDECENSFYYDSEQKLCIRSTVSTGNGKETIDVIKKTSEVSVNVAIGTTAAATFAMSIVSPNANFLQQFLSIQKINFLLLLNFPFPDILYQFSKSISGTNPLYLLNSINIFPSLLNESEEQYSGSLKEGKFKQENIKTSIIENTGGILLVILANNILFIPAVILHQKRKQKRKEFKEVYNRGVLISPSQLEKQGIVEKVLNKAVGILSIQVHELLSIVLTFALTLQIFSFNNKGMDYQWSILAIKGIFLCVLAIYSFAAFFFYVRFINKYYNKKTNDDLLSPIAFKELNPECFENGIEEKEKVKKSKVDPTLPEIIFSYYIQDYIKNLNVQRNFRFISTAIENIIIPLCIIVPFANCFVQISLCLAFQSILLLTALLMRPHKSMVNNIELFTSHIIWVATFILFLLLAVKIKTEDNLSNLGDDEKDTLNKLSIVIMICLLLLLFSPPIFLVIKFCKEIPNLIRIIKQKLMKNKDGSKDNFDTNQSQANLLQQQQPSFISPMIRGKKTTIQIQERMIELNEYSFKKTITKKEFVMLRLPSKKMQKQTITSANHVTMLTSQPRQDFLRSQTIKKIAKLKTNQNFSIHNQLKQQSSLESPIDVYERNLLNLKKQ